MNQQKINSMNLLNYWKFFSANTFLRDSELTFFADGSFAISIYQKVTLYNAECKLCQSWDDDKVLFLSNGIIATVNKNSNRLITYRNGFAATTLDIEGFKTVTAAENAIHVTFADGTDKFMFVDKDGQIQIAFSLGISDYCLADMSANGRIIILRYYGPDPFCDQPAKILKDLKDISPKGCCRAEFLEDKKHYICKMSRYTKCCVLFNDEAEEIYASSSSSGIIPLGDCICLEGKIVATLNMDIIGEAKNLQAVYGNDRDFYCISPHKIRLKDQYGYWLSSYGMELLLNTKECKLIGYFNEGRFYVMDLLDSSIHAQAVLFCEKDTSTAWTSYRNIINSMIPKPRVL
jgi:hypothetical protein